MTAEIWTQPRSLDRFEPLQPAERKLLEERDTGLGTLLGTGVPPVTNPPLEVRVRASFLRWLILGADGADGHTHEIGLRIVGAFIESDGPEGAAIRGLNLGSCDVNSSLGLYYCRFEDKIWLDRARCMGLFFDGSFIPGLDGDGVEVNGDFFMRNGFRCEGEIRLLGAKISGDFSLNRAALRNEKKIALNADAMIVSKNVFMSNFFTAKGELRILGARIGGNLYLTKAKVFNPDIRSISADGIDIEGSIFLEGVWSKGEARFLGSTISGDFDCSSSIMQNKNGRAISLDGAHIDRAFILAEGAIIEGQAHLPAVEIGHLNDNVDSWPKGVGEIVIDRCIYGAFTGLDVNAKARIKWLDRQSPPLFAREFWPQPWEQCAKVLRDMGHAEDARAVLIAKEQRQRAIRRARIENLSLKIWRALADHVLGAVVGYVYRPTRAFLYAAGLWLIGAVLFLDAWDASGFMPNNAFVLRAPEWVRCGAAVNEIVSLAAPAADGSAQSASGLRSEGQSQLDCFLYSTAEAESYPDFSALVYSADALLPVVDFGQEATWMPNPNTGPGAAARVWLWLQILSGWALSLLAVAGFSGLVKSD